jgi:hypothetical protein
MFLVSLSCTKNDDYEIQKCNLSKIIYGEGIGQYTYTAYYENNLIKELISISNSEKIEFEYSENGFISKREFFNIGNPQVMHRSQYTTNSSGQILERKNWRYENNEMIYIGKQTYEYSGSKLQKIQNYYIDDISILNTLELIWDGLNPVVVNQLGQDRLPDYSAHITYDTSKINKFNSTFSNFQQFYPFESIFLIWQSLSYNTPTSSISYFNNNSSETRHYQYSLLYNGLTSEIYYNDFLWIKYEYDCE